MISGTAKGNGTFSADVKLYLYVDGAQIELGQLGPGFAILRDAQNITASEGEIESIVDQKITRWRVKFPSPITSESRRFAFESV